jgi:hypothetical protein
MRHEHFLTQENLGRTVTLQTNNKLMLHSFNENRKLIQRKNAELAIYPCLAMITSPSVHPSKTKQSSLRTLAATGAPTVPPPLLLIITQRSLSALLSSLALSCILGLAPPDPSSKRII